jgi:hypothetical protein
MSKVSIGLRGWRFEEREVFTEDGDFRPLTEIPEDARHRLVRLALIVERPCDACYLVHGDAEKERCRQATIVYGEPLDEVLLCDHHEADFLYWFREAGGRELTGDDEFTDEFHEWFAAGGRAPEGYAGLEYVETDPDSLPDPPDAQEVQRRLEAANDFEGETIDLRELAARGVDGADGDDDGSNADEAAGTDEREDGDDEQDDVDVDVDFGADYPTR